jgi:uncharacterized membrane protein YeaQ/YmgE (transglycosylase-associated protein family)
MVTFIIVLIVIGLIAGLMARLLLPGRDSLGILGTIVLGIIGSIIGAFVLLLLLRVTGLERGRRR